MKVVLIGSGNVATHMAIAFKAAGHTILQIWSATFEHALTLAEGVDAIAISNLSDLDQEAELIVIAVNDDAIEQVAAKLEDSNALVVHTSGATNLTSLSGLKHYGVLYPLQTFSKARAIDFSLVPLCIEGSDESSFATLKIIAESLSTAVYRIDSAKRKILHVAAAFACNFVNQLYALSSDLLLQNEMDFSLLKPLILETAEKVQSLTPFGAQTGPALRRDEKTLAAHLDLLEGLPELQNIYQTLSDSIKKSHQ
jgi:predicted short-subunit dehydrogenase-like oxidoreductase (DUF2520 family)